MRSPETRLSSRAKPSLEGSALSFALSQCSPALSALQVGMAALMVETVRSLPAEIAGEIALSSFALSVIVGGIYEVGTLRRSGFSANPFTSLAHLKFDNPVLSSVAGNITAQALSVLNPIEVGVAAGSLAGHDAHFGYAYLMARNVVGLAYTVGVNFTIRQGVTQELIGKIQQGKKLVIDAVEQFTRNTGLYELDQRVFPAPTYIDYPDHTSGDHRIKSPKPSFHDVLWP